MDPSLPAPELVALLLQHNRSLRDALESVTVNLLGSLESIATLTQENTCLHGVIQVQYGGGGQAKFAGQALGHVPMPTIPLIDRLSNQKPLLARMEPITFLLISDVPVIQDPVGHRPLLEQISSSPPPPQLPPGG